ncbi:hypothetical protein IFR05_000180 [Cadophora sp. M221]|nr:hypothetical protein IFR05_000180 [Cadophora sp. M221]
MSAPPILDFSPFYGNDAIAKDKLVEDSLDEKRKVSKDLNTWNRGYEFLRSQMLEVGTAPELKEGYYIGEDLPTTHPYFLQKKLNSGPNIWPEIMDGADDFKKTTMDYYQETCKLARDVLKVLALTLELPETYFDDFTTGAVATMRLLHYPPQSADSDEKLSRGIGAHTDFGAVTLLLQEEVDGLQVWEKDTQTWLDVEPTKGAYVVNLGNMFMRSHETIDQEDSVLTRARSNDRYISNLHRVINKSGKERYSIPVFFSGNPDYMIECLPHCCEEGQKPKYPPISVADVVGGSYKESYGRAEAHKEKIEKQSHAADVRQAITV